MKISRRCHNLLLVALFLTGLFPAAASAQDSKKFDAQIYESLREVINAGAELYNKEESDPVLREQNRAACYRLYQGSLITLEPLVPHRPEMQKIIHDGLFRAVGLRSNAERAFALNKVLSEIRDLVNPKQASTDKKTVVESSSAPETLWARLGGQKVVSMAMDTLVDKCLTDPRIDFFRGGKIKKTDLEMALLKQSMIAYVSAATDGPSRYTGKSMAQVHKGMGITGSQFDAFMAEMRKTFRDRGANPAAVDELVKRLESTRSDIVEVNKEKEIGIKDIGIGFGEKKEETKK